jgi:hypothetical protein
LDYYKTLMHDIAVATETTPPQMLEYALLLTFCRITRSARTKLYKGKAIPVAGHDGP